MSTRCPATSGRTMPHKDEPQGPRCVKEAGHFGPHKSDGHEWLACDPQWECINTKHITSDGTPCLHAPKPPPVLPGADIEIKFDATKM